MTATALIRHRKPPVWRRAAGVLVVMALTAVLAGACTTREVEDFLYASGKIAYDSMKARQQGE